MTGISPLQSIHKKGLFGDHHKKNENQILNITEVNNYAIIQIFHYKNSKVDLNSINIDSLKFPLKNSEVSSNNKTRILWSAPNTWLLISQKEDVIKNIKKVCKDEDFAITDISHSRAIIQIKGLQAKEVLKKGCPINFNEFDKNNCIGSVFHGITIVVDCLDNEPQTFNILALRSFGESLYNHITDASLEFGYDAI